MLLGLMLGTAAAQPPGGASGSARIVDRGAETDARPAQQGPVSLERAVEIATRRFEGRVVRAETRTIEGRRVHVVRILDEASGRVRNVQVDAETGRVR